MFGLVNLGTNALALRAFGLGDLGVALLLHAYARLFSDVLKFQSWQAVLRYGAAEEEATDRRGLERLLGFTLGLDLVAAALAIGCALLFLPWAETLFDWSPEVAGLAPWFLLCIPFIMPATPNGALRLFDRVDALAAQHALNAIFRLIGVGLAILLDGSAAHIVAAWFTASVLSGAWVFVVFGRELRQRRLRPRFDVAWTRAGGAFPGIWRFLWSTNAASTVQLAVSHLTTLFVGARLGAEAAGAFEIARQFAAAISKPARMLGPLILPDLSRLSAQGRWEGIGRFLGRQLVATAAGLAVLGGVLYVALGPLVGRVYGPELLPHVELFQLLVGATLIAALGFALEPTLLAGGRAGSALAIQAGAATLYAPLAFLLSERAGLTGVGLALLLHSVLLHVALALAALQIVRRLGRANPHRQEG